MAGIVPTGLRYRPLPAVTLTAGDWRADGVVVAASFRERLVGIRHPTASGLLLHTGSVHGIGLSEPLRVVHLTRSGRVVADERLEPGRVVGASSYWLLEVPVEVPAPPVGARLAVVPSSPG